MIEILGESETFFDCDELLAEIERKKREAISTRREIERLKSNFRERIRSHSSINFSGQDKNINKSGDDFDNEEVSFEDEFSYYLENYRSLNENVTIEDIISILPSRMHCNFDNILFRLYAESLKAIKEINEFLLSDIDDLCVEDLELFKHEIMLEKGKMLLLESVFRDEDKKIIPEKAKNKIILVPLSSGRIRIIEELNSIPVEFYDRFLELINSIIDGTFKGVKNFRSNGNLARVYEVKLFKVRLVFARITPDSYALITAFLKKDDSNKFYRETLNRKVADYKKIAEKLREKVLNDEEFRKNNDFYVQQLFDLLSNNNEMIEGDCYDKRKSL